MSLLTTHRAAAEPDAHTIGTAVASFGLVVLLLWVAARRSRELRSSAFHPTPHLMLAIATAAAIAAMVALPSFDRWP